MATIHWGSLALGALLLYLVTRFLLKKSTA